jgi:hypothetical protein
MGGPPERITLVDDFITKGATVLAGAARLAEAFPDAEIQAFVLVRTQRPAGDPGGKHLFRAIVDPVYNQVVLSPYGYGAWRQDPNASHFSSRRPVGSRSDRHRSSVGVLVGAEHWPVNRCEDFKQAPEWSLSGPWAS